MAATTAPTMLTRVHDRGDRQSPTNGARGPPTKIIPLPNRNIAATRALITVAGCLGDGNKLIKAVAAARGTAQEMQHLKGRDLSDWTARRAVEAHGLTPVIGAQVVRVTPPDLSIIDSELSKLAAYKASGSKLTNEAVTELLAGGREDEIFKLTDNLLPRPTPQALQIARNLTRGGLQPTSVAYRMARHAARMRGTAPRHDPREHRPPTPHPAPHPPARREPAPRSPASPSAS